MSLLERIRERQAELPPVQAKPQPSRRSERHDADLQAEYEEADRVDWIADHVERLRREGKEGPPALFIRPD